MMRTALITLMLVVCTACVTTTTRLAPISPAAIVAEEAIQREIVLLELSKAEQRLDDLAFELLAAASPLCEDDVTRTIGVSFRTIHGYDGEWSIAARAALGLTETLTITSVAAGSPAATAGIQEGDRLLVAGGSQIPVGSEAPEVAQEAINTAASFGDVRLTVRGADGDREVIITPVPACDYGLVVPVEGGINAWADGENIVFPWAMMRFANDDELRVILSHEIAHNAMGHIAAKKKNALLGGILGAVLDGVTAAVDPTYSPSGENTATFMAMGAEAHSQDFEREADYVGMYILARANLPLATGPNVWRHMAQIDPASIGYASSHPTTAERFVRLGEAINEIERKRRMNLELLPEMKDPQ